MVIQTTGFQLTAILLGLFGLIWSADRFVQAAVVLAKRFNISTFIIGMTIVSLGTSAPEILVSVIAAISGSAGIAIGNAIGSNIANLGLVLGVTTIITPMAIDPQLKHKELPILLLTTALCAPLFFDNYFGHVDGLILLLYGAFLGLWLLGVIPGSKQHLQPTLTDPAADQNRVLETSLPLRQAIVWFSVALIVLLISSRSLVWGAAHLARNLGVDETLIGLTIVAIGTSLPELAASAASAIKKHPDMAIGNVLGSNIFNLLLVLPWPGILAAGHIQPTLFKRDYAVMVTLTVLMALMIYLQKDTPRIGRRLGFLFFVGYISYITALAV